VNFWIDAQLPPQLAQWLTNEFQIQARSVRDVGLRDAADLHIFQQARQAGIVLISKDSDFVELISPYGAPPQLL
jgi:predicted nuclease of predicted toxin-antitoxin system